MRIIIVDDNKNFKEAMAMFLEIELQHEIIADYDNGLDLLNDKKLIDADIILLDIEMPKLNGIQTMHELNKIYSWIKAIAITDYHEMAYLKDLVQKGFKGCVFKDSIYKELEHALITVQNGGFSFPKNITLD